MRMWCCFRRWASVLATNIFSPLGSISAWYMAVATVPGVGMKHCTCLGRQPRLSSQDLRSRMSWSVQPGNALIKVGDDVLFLAGFAADPGEKIQEFFQVFFAGFSHQL